MSAWISALKKLNHENPNAWIVPRKGTANYETVKGLMNRTDSKEKMAEPAPAPAPVAKKKSEEEQKKIEDEIKDIAFDEVSKVIKKIRNTLDVHKWEIDSIEGVISYLYDYDMFTKEKRKEFESDFDKLKTIFNKALNDIFKNKPSRYMTNSEYHKQDYKLGYTMNEFSDITRKYEKIIENEIAKLYSKYDLPLPKFIPVPK
jgi:hypothetical protein